MDFGASDLMPTSPRIFSLNLGSQTIGLGEFKTQPHGGLILQNYSLRELLLDPQGEGVRGPQLESVCTRVDERVPS